MAVPDVQAGLHGGAAARADAGALGARARRRGRAVDPVEDGVRSAAAGELAVALHDAGEFDGALSLFEEMLVVERRIHSIEEIGKVSKGG